MTSRSTTVISSSCRFRRLSRQSLSLSSLSHSARQSTRNRWTYSKTHTVLVACQRGGRRWHTVTSDRTGTCCLGVVRHQQGAQAEWQARRRHAQCQARADKSLASSACSSNRRSHHHCQGQGQASQGPGVAQQRQPRQQQSSAAATSTRTLAAIPGLGRHRRFHHRHGIVRLALMREPVTAVTLSESSRSSKSMKWSTSQLSRQDPAAHCH